MPPGPPGAWTKRDGIETLYPASGLPAGFGAPVVSGVWSPWALVVNPVPLDFIACGQYLSVALEAVPQLAFAHVYGQLGIGPNAASVTPLPSVVSSAFAAIVPPFAPPGTFVQAGDYFPISPQEVPSGTGLWVRGAIYVQYGTWLRLGLALYVAGYDAGAVPDPYTPLRNDLRFQGYYNGTSRKFPPGLGVNTFPGVAGTWYELDPSLPNDIVIQGFSLTSPPTFNFYDHLELGSGAVGAEVARCRMGVVQVASFLMSCAGRPVWPQVFFAGERLVVRRTQTTLSSAIIVTYEDLPGP